MFFSKLVLALGLIEIMAYFIMLHEGDPRDERIIIFLIGILFLYIGWSRMRSIRLQRATVELIMEEKKANNRAIDSHD